MKSYIVMGIFAFLSAIIALVRIMSYQEFHRITAMKRAWGRRRGLALYFISSVVLPLICGIVFISSGVSGVKLIQPLIGDKPFNIKEIAPAVIEPEYGPFFGPVDIPA